MALPHGTTVRVHYRGTLEDGTEFDSSEGREPLEFTVGEQQVIAGFEEAVCSLDVGSSAMVTLDAEEAYGPRIDEAVQEVPLSQFWETPEVGMVVRLIGPDKQELAASVIEVGEEMVKLDFNHPLAGQPLTFMITLVEADEPE